MEKNAYCHSSHFDKPYRWHTHVWNEATESSALHFSICTCWCVRIVSSSGQNSLLVIFNTDQKEQGGLPSKTNNKEGV